MIKEIWFDTAGTLYKETPEFDTARSAYVYRVFGEVTGEMDPAKAKAHHDELYAKYGSDSMVFESLGKPHDWWQQKFEEFNPNNFLKPDPEITETLRRLKDAVPISVFTNVRPAMLDDLLRHLGIPTEWFTHKLSAMDVGKPKPHLAGFFKMVELSAAPASQILYVGDKVNKDILPAKQVGLQTCLLWAQSPEANFSVKTFPELLDIVSSSITR